MFADTLKILKKAQKGKYAVGHFNINNMEICQAVVNAANKTKSPIILSTSEGALKYAGMDYLFNIAQTAASSSKIPIAFHLDHGKDFNTIKSCIKKGYSSVMFDGSKLSFEDNIRKTKRIVNLAHKKGVSVEAELGTIGGTEDFVTSKKITYVDPKEVKEFVERTGCDILAIGIGTSHGAFKFKGKATLRFDLLKQIRSTVKTPLVLHGASGIPRNIVTMATKYGADLSGVMGIPDSQIKKAISLGITKINTDTDLRIAFDAGIRKVLIKQPKDFDPRHIVGSARDLMQKVAEHRMEVFGSTKKG